MVRLKETADKLTRLAETSGGTRLLPVSSSEDIRLPLEDPVRVKQAIAFYPLVYRNLYHLALEFSIKHSYNGNLKPVIEI